MRAWTRQGDQSTRLRTGAGEKSAAAEPGVARAGSIGKTAGVDGSFAAFVGISAVVIITPGPDTILTIRNTLTGGRPAGLATAAGVALGQSAWTVAASLGLAAVLIASQPAFLAIRLLGAAYLVYLGVHLVRDAVRGGPAREGSISPGVRLPPRTAFRQGTLSNLANPKMAIFFTSLLPQFVGQGPSAFGSMLGLGLVFVAMTACWLSGYAAVIALVGHAFRRGPIGRALDAIAGAILVAFGLRLAATPR